MVKSLAVWLFLLACGSVSAAVPVPDVQVANQGMQVVINLPQTRLFLFQDGQLLKSFPVAVGKMLTKTPTGSFAVTAIYHDPSWNVPKSIQAEMRAKGKPVLTVVPPGDNNPLGKVFIRFGEPGLGLGIHGTNAPQSVPGFRSHGCVRMKNEDALTLSSEVNVGASVTVAYQSILLNQDVNGQLWLTAYPNLYRSDDVSMRLLAQVLLDWQREHALAVFGRRVDTALSLRNGKPVCLTCRHDDTAYTGQKLYALRWLSAPPDSSAPQAEVPDEARREPGPPIASGTPNSTAGADDPRGAAQAPVLE